jgi:hypothetical protein
LAYLPGPSNAIAQSDTSNANPSSLDSLWMDQTPKTAAPVAAPAKPSFDSQAKADNTEMPAVARTATTEALAGDLAAPMCKLSAFQDSMMVSKGGWPGVGPFRPANNANEFADAQHNRVRLQLQGDQIGRAELSLGGWQQSRDIMLNVLNLQMDTDFFLESLGIKAPRIQELNGQIEKRREAIFKDGSPVNIITGRYQVNIERKQPDGSGPLVITINSMDANKNAIKQAAIEPVTPAPLTEDKPPVTVTPAPAKSTAPDRAHLKLEFAQLINEWQAVKKAAVKAKQTDRLDTVLAGKALTRQINAINWLVTNHRYYDMDPKKVSIEQFTEILPGKKYMVSAQVREAYKFVDDQSKQVLKEVDDTNRVNYTVEKLSGKWLITDSAILSGGNGHSLSANKSSH